jgi:hypothetical protein
MNTRAEVTDGFNRLGRYLFAWAEFEDWLRRRGPDGPRRGAV